MVMLGSVDGTIFWYSTPANIISSGTTSTGYQVHQIHQEHPDKDRQRQGRNQLVVAMERVFNLVVDELDNHLDKVDQARGSFGRGAHGNPPKESTKNDT
jgi:hypothetical protein